MTASTLPAATTTRITTARGITCDVMVFGDDGPPVVAFHGVGGHLAGEPALARLAAQGCRVFAPVWPGFGADTGETELRDMLDFTLHGADVVSALAIERPHLVGHSFGGMIAAEMAALAPDSYASLSLIAPAGLWLDDHPIPDIYSMLPFEFPDVMFHDPAASAALLTGGVDFEDPAAMTEFMIANSRRLGTAGKVLFPIPNRRLSTRLYRLTTPTTIVWGESDRLIPIVYAERWRELIPHATLVRVAEAGHMAPYEQPDAVADAVAGAVLG